MASHDEAVEMKLAELMADRADELYQLTIGIRRVVVSAAVGSTELLYKTYAVSDVFSFTHRMREAFIHIAVYAKHVNLGFNQGSSLSDPKGILEGTGKSIRHIRIDSLEVLATPEVEKLIAAAVEQGLEMTQATKGVQPQSLIDKTT